MKYKNELYDIIRHYTMQTELQRAVARWEALPIDQRTPEHMAVIDADYKTALDSVDLLQSDYSLNKEIKQDVTQVLIHRIKNLITDYCSTDK